MIGNIRPETMERITTPEHAKAFIDEQIAEGRDRSSESNFFADTENGPC